MKLRILLWILTRMMIRANRKNEAFHNEILKNDALFQIKTADNLCNKNFIIRKGEINTAPTVSGDPDFIISFINADYGFSVLVSKDKNAFINGLLEDKIKIEGNFPLLVWFQNLISLMRSSGTKKADFLSEIGFIGTGIIGAPMARSLLRGGHTVKAYDIDPQALERIVKDGAIGCSSLDDLADVPVVIIMVNSMDQVEEVVSGLCSSFPDGSRRTVVIMSTVSPDAVLQLRKNLNDTGREEIQILDAPVSGAPLNAEAGKLSIMVGGDKPAYDRVKPILESMGENIFYMGPTGSGSAMKLVNNIIGISGMLNTIEALSLGAKKGLDPDMMARVINAGAGKNFITEQWALSKILFDMLIDELSQNPESTILATGLKDLQTAKKWAELSSIETPCVDKALGLWEKMTADKTVSLIKSILKN